MDYDELTLNPMLAEIETEASSGEPDAEKKHRRCWLPKEEECFYEIWGRENWRLTRNGKNTIQFALWSEELSERWNIHVKPDEVQTKVNQTKAKYRQVSKNMEQEKTNVTKWKKFEVIHKILSNQYRPKDAEPIPLSALEKSREFSTVHTGPIATAPVAASAGDGEEKAMPAEETSADVPLNLLVEREGKDSRALVDALNVNQSTDLNSLNSNAIFNTSDTLRNNQFNTELFTDPIDEIKQEEFTDEFGTFEGNNIFNNEGQEQTQLTQLEIPQQQLQQQQQQQQLQQQLEQQQLQQHYQQQQYQTQPQTQATNLQTQQQQLEQQIQQIQQMQQQQQTQPQQQQPPHYDQSLNSYPMANNSASSSNPRSLLPNRRNQYNSGTKTRAPRVTQNSTGGQQKYANNNLQYANAAPAAVDALPVSVSNNGSNGNNGTNMQPPSSVKTVVTPTRTRKRRTQAAIQSAAAAAPDSLESMYLEEVRKKNLILDEQKEISRKRLQLEERKISLMEQFFPQCLALQQQILQKLNTK